MHVIYSPSAGAALSGLLLWAFLGTAQAEAERQAENARTAELRRTALMGIYAGKGC